MIDDELITELLNRVHNYTEEEKRIYAIKELEKIKEEIEGIRLLEENVDSSWCAGLKYVNNKIIDKHIAELKGSD